jgi:hypothetical protein
MSAGAPRGRGQQETTVLRSVPLDKRPTCTLCDWTSKHACSRPSVLLISQAQPVALLMYDCLFCPSKPLSTVLLYRQIQSTAGACHRASQVHAQVFRPATPSTTWGRPCAQPAHGAHHDAGSTLPSRPVHHHRPGYRARSGQAGTCPSRSAGARFGLIPVCRAHRLGLLHRACTLHRLHRAG